VIERMVILSDDGVLANPLRPTHDATVVGLPANTKLKDSERALIEAALEAAGWVIGGPYGAAVKLDIKRTTLMHTMKKLGIFCPQLENNIDQTVQAGPER